MQRELFSAKGMAVTVVLPPPPALHPHSWPYPGLSPADSARAALANSSAYADLVASVIKIRGGEKLTGSQVLALVPGAWKDLLGQWAHGSLSADQGVQRGVAVKYVPHDGGGFHFEYQALDAL
jgi:hypothetical protein